MVEFFLVSYAYLIYRLYEILKPFGIDFCTESTNSNINGHGHCSFKIQIELQIVYELVNE